MLAARNVVHALHEVVNPQLPHMCREGYSTWSVCLCVFVCPSTLFSYISCAITRQTRNTSDFSCTWAVSAIFLCLHLLAFRYMSCIRLILCIRALLEPGSPAYIQWLSGNTFASRPGGGRFNCFCYQFLGAFYPSSLTVNAQ